LSIGIISGSGSCDKQSERSCPDITRSPSQWPADSSRTLPLPAAAQCSVPDSGQTLQSAATTKQAGLPWLLLGLLVCAPIVRAQTAGFDRQPVEIFGTVFLEGANRPIGDIIVNIRSLVGGPFASFLTDRGGRFQVLGLDPGVYEIVVEQPGYEPVRETLRLYGISPPLELHLRESNPSPVWRTDYTVSVRN